MTIGEFLCSPMARTAAQWGDVRRWGMLLEGVVHGHYLKVEKASGWYTLTVSYKTGGELYVGEAGCGCPFASCRHRHTWQGYGTAQEAVTATAAVIINIKLGADVMLDFNQPYPF